MAELTRGETPFRVDDPGVGGAALGDETVYVDEPGFVGAGLAGRCLGEQVRQKLGRLDVAPGPAFVRTGDDLDSVFLSPGKTGGVYFAHRHDQRDRKSTRLLQSRRDLVCRLLLEKKNKINRA